jgi:valyl-tRNA synthetase
MSNLNTIQVTENVISDAISFRVKSTTFFVTTTTTTTTTTLPPEELATLQEELAYARNFLDSVNIKLANERFVSSAPAVIVEKEKAKKADAEAKIRVLEERIAVING